MNRRLVIAGAVALFAVPAARAQTPAAAPAAPAAPAARLPVDSLAIARRYWDWLQTSRFDSIVAHTPPEARASLAELESQWANFVARVGNETQLVAERWIRRNGHRQYWRVSRYSDFAQENVVVRIVILPDGSIGGLGMNPESRTPPIDPEP